MPVAPLVGGKDLFKEWPVGYEHPVIYAHPLLRYPGLGTELGIDDQDELDQARLKSFGLPDATWRRSLISRPPIARMSVSTVVNLSSYSIEKKYGINLGDVLNLKGGEPMFLSGSFDWSYYEYGEQLRQLSRDEGAGKGVVR